MAYDIAESVLECIGTYQLQLYGQVKNIELYCTHFQNKINPIQTVSLGFIRKIFLKFRKLQPWYSYKKKIV